MKIKSIFLSILLIVNVAWQTCGQQLTIGSYNVRYANKNDTGDMWADRAPVVANLLRFHDFDIFGTQKALKN